MKRLIPFMFAAALFLFPALARAAGELKAVDAPGKTVYAEILSPSGQVWNGTAFEAETDANWSNYKTLLTQQGAGQVYVGAFPTGIVTAGRYSVVYYEQAASALPSNLILQQSVIDWTGSTVASDGVNTVTLANTTAALSTVNTNTSTLLLSLATYQSTLTTGSTTTALNTALTGTADLTGGKVVFTAGVNKGVARTIAAMNTTTGAITLLSAVPTTPGATDAFSVVQGSKALEQFLAGLGTDSRPVLSANTQPAVTLPTTAPAGYGGATGDTSGVTTLLARIPGTVQPQTGDAFAAATAAPAATATALMTKPITGTGLTLGQEFVLLGLASVKVASIANTWNSTTHILTTAYSTTGGVVVLTTSAQYPPTQVLSPALSGVSAAVGTVPQP